MTFWTWLLISLIIILIFSSQVAGRLDKLHRRVSSARTTLWRRCNERYEAALASPNDEVRRAALTAKKAAETKLFSPRHLLAESELTRVMQLEPISISLDRTQLRLQDARRMYNEAVRATLYLRSWRISRWLRLAGRATAPKYVDFDDSALTIQ